MTDSAIITRASGNRPFYSRRKTASAAIIDFPETVLNAVSTAGNAFYVLTRVRGCDLISGFGVYRAGNSSTFAVASTGISVFLRPVGSTATGSVPTDGFVLGNLSLGAGAGGDYEIARPYAGDRETEYEIVAKSNKAISVKPSSESGAANTRILSFRIDFLIF